MSVCEDATDIVFPPQSSLLRIYNKGSRDAQFTKNLFL